MAALYTDFTMTLVSVYSDFGLVLFGINVPKVLKVSLSLHVSLSALIFSVLCARERENEWDVGHKTTSLLP